MRSLKKGGPGGKPPREDKYKEKSVLIPLRSLKRGVLGGLPPEKISIENILLAIKIDAGLNWPALANLRVSRL